MLNLVTLFVLIAEILQKLKTVERDFASGAMSQAKKRCKVVHPDPNPRIRMALEDFKSVTLDPLTKAKYQACLEALARYPLPMPDIKHCKILAGFDQLVIDKLSTHLEGTKPPLLPGPTDLEELSPIRGVESQKNPVVSVSSSDESEDLILARQLSQELNGDLNDSLRKRQEEEDRLLALKLNSENYPVHTEPHLSPVKRKISCQFHFDEAEICLDFSAKRVSGVLGDIRVPKIDPDLVEVTPPPSTSRGTSKPAAKGISAKAMLFSQDPVLALDMDGDESFLERVAEECSGTRTRIEPKATTSSRTASKTGRSNTHFISDCESDEPVIEEPKVLKPKLSRGKAKKPEKKTTTTRIKTIKGMEVIKSHEIPEWVLEMGRGNDEDEERIDPQALKSDITLNPGQFEVILIVDTAEVTGGGGGKARGATSNKKAMTIKELAANGVQHETRKLHVGDFIWIAKEKVDLDPSRLRQKGPKELVLPYIVERKRMDDLKSSIIDGRYKEQKSRLRECGLPYKWYLVEEYAKKMKYWANGANNQKFNLQALEQAIATTSAVEGFNIKRTEDQKESVAFLTMATRFLQGKYANKTLQSCRYEDLELNLVVDVDHTLLGFKEFNDNSRKNKPLTLKDGFGRILCHQHGVTWTMAKGIADHYSTLANLMETYSQIPGQVERERLLEGLEYDKGKKKIGSNVSKIISWLYSDGSLK